MPPDAIPARAPAVISAGVVFVCAAVVIVAVSALLRYLGANNDLWLDEIWSLEFARGLVRARDVFTLHHDNNHYINTLWLRTLGDGQSAITYRIPSIVAGIGSVIVAGRIGLRFSRGASLFAMLLTGTSYQLVLHSSEARGYSLAVFCTLAAYASLASEFERPRGTAVLWYNASAVVGMLAHPLFAPVLAAAALWHLGRMLRARLAIRDVLEFVRCQGAPLALLLILFFVDYRFVEIGGGTPTGSVPAVLAAASMWALGVPSVTVLGVAALLALATSGLFSVGKRAPGEAAFLVAAIIVTPLLFLAIRPAEFVYVRYFVVGNALLLVTVAIALGWMWTHGAPGRFLAGCLGLSIVVANLIPFEELHRYGRSQHSAAIAYMREHSRGELVSIGGDHDFRIGKVVSHFLAESQVPDRYVPLYLWGNGPQWIITHGESFKAVPPPKLEMESYGGIRYVLARVFPTAPHAGLHWYLYADPARTVPSSSDRGRESTSR